MKLGVYTAVLHDRDLPEALDVIKELGLAKPSEHDWTITDVQRKKDL